MIEKTRENYDCLVSRYRISDMSAKDIIDAFNRCPRGCGKNFPGIEDIYNAVKVIDEMGKVSVLNFQKEPLCLQRSKEGCFLSDKVRESFCAPAFPMSRNAVISSLLDDEVLSSLFEAVSRYEPFSISSLVYASAQNYISCLIKTVEDIREWLKSSLNENIGNTLDFFGMSEYAVKVILSEGTVEDFYSFLKDTRLIWCPEFVSPVSLEVSGISLSECESVFNSEKVLYKNFPENFTFSRSEALMLSSVDTYEIQDKINASYKTLSDRETCIRNLPDGLLSKRCTAFLYFCFQKNLEPLLKETLKNAEMSEEDKKEVTEYTLEKASETFKAFSDKDKDLQDIWAFSSEIRALKKDTGISKEDFEKFVDTTKERKKEK